MAFQAKRMATKLSPHRSKVHYHQHLAWASIRCSLLAISVLVAVTRVARDLGRLMERKLASQMTSTTTGMTLIARGRSHKRQRVRTGTMTTACERRRELITLNENLIITFII